jgi:hypothetical protein
MELSGMKNVFFFRFKFMALPFSLKKKMNLFCNPAQVQQMTRHSASEPDRLL